MGLIIVEETKPPVSSKGLAGELDLLCERIKNEPWTELAKLKSDRKLAGKLDEALELLRQLKKNISD